MVVIGKNLSASEPMPKLTKKQDPTVGSTDAGQLLQHIIDYYTPVYPEYYHYGQACTKLYDNYNKFAIDVVRSNLPDDRKKHILALQYQQCEATLQKSDLPPLVKELLKGCLNSIKAA